MSWTYSQSTGQLVRAAKTVHTGYSGKDTGKNNPDMQHVHDVGPLPRGHYTVGDPYDSETHGPHVLRLTPAEENEMFGRAGFLIHGDSLNDPGTASNGCIILPRAIREQISDSEDRHLEVIA